MNFMQWRDEVALLFAGMIEDADLPEQALPEMYEEGLPPYEAAQYAADIAGQERMDRLADEMCDW